MYIIINILFFLSIAPHVLRAGDIVFVIKKGKDPVFQESRSEGVKYRLLSLLHCSTSKFVAMYSTVHLPQIKFCVFQFKFKVISYSGMDTEYQHFKRFTVHVLYVCELWMKRNL